MESINGGLTVLVLLGMVLSAALNVFLYVRVARTQQPEALTVRVNQLQQLHDKHVSNTASRFDVQRQGVARLRERLSVAETKIAALPTHDDVVDIQRQLSQLASTVAGIDERSDATFSMVQTIQTHLLESNKP